MSFLRLEDILCACDQFRFGWSIKAIFVNVLIETVNTQRRSISVVGTFYHARPKISDINSVGLFGLKLKLRAF